MLDYWLVVEPYPSEKYELVNWDDDIPNIWENKHNVPNHQPEDNDESHMMIVNLGPKYHVTHNPKVTL